MRAILLLAATGLTVPAAAQYPTADSQELSRDYAACMKLEEERKDPGAMAICAQDEVQRQTALIDQAYRVALRRSPPTRRRELRESQSEWAREREKTCGEDDTTPFGPSRRFSYAQCTIDAMVERRLMLQRRY